MQTLTGTSSKRQGGLIKGVYLAGMAAVVVFAAFGAWQALGRTNQRGQVGQHAVQAAVAPSAGLSGSGAAPATASIYLVPPADAGTLARQIAAENAMLFQNGAPDQSVTVHVVSTAEQAQQLRDGVATMNAVRAANGLPALNLVDLTTTAAASVDTPRAPEQPR